MDSLLYSPALQAHTVLALAGLTSAYVAVMRPTLSHRKGEAHTSPPATLYEAGTSPVLSSASLAVFRAVLAIYIVGMGLMQLSDMGPYVLKFYTIWNWWLLGLYFALAAVASYLCTRKEAAEATASAESASAPTKGSGVKTADAKAAQPLIEGTRPLTEKIQGCEGPQPPSPPSPSAAHLATTPLSRACHALFMINSSTVIIVDVVCWAVLYPMLAMGEQTPEIQLILRRLLLSFTSYNQHGLNALYIFVEMFLNRHRLAFHAVGPLGLWSLIYALWAHAWHAKTGKWLYPFLNTSKRWAPGAYLGLYVVHWMAFGIVAILYQIKLAWYGKWFKSPACEPSWKAKRQ
ncbi:hypothetical protein Vafri_3241 [Volvox africanus]|uniref:Uncharacterized protein n=1 Tax=Volvox africanus TaxID=51714 RepID=A0A8J4ETG8_9CHLO|nr:hypothetical protein Vafri_3241 [Volvox africanus]